MTAFIFSLLWTSLFCHGEYRAFLLQLRDPQGKILKEFKSSLDPLQYPGYFALPTGTTLTYSKTWMCKGSTAGESPICNPPAPPPATTPSPMAGSGNLSPDSNSSSSTPKSPGATTSP